MPGENGPISASRFSISIDGVEVGAFRDLTFAARFGFHPRNLEAHELAHLVQQRPMVVTKKWPLVLKQGFLRQSAIAKLQVPGWRRVSIQAAAPGARITLSGARIQSSSGQAAKGAEVAMEELVLAYEGLS